MELKDQRIDTEQLMIERLSGIIDAEGAMRLDDLIRKDETVRARWNELYEQFDKAGSQQYLDAIDVSEALSKLRNGMAQNDQQGESAIGARRGLRQGRRMTMVRLGIAIAAVLILVVTIGMVYFSKRSAVVAPIAQVRAPDREVKLYVGGKKALNLSQAVGEDATGVSYVKLKIGRGKLSYEPINGYADHTLNTLVVPATMTYHLELTEGIDVWLNSESQLKFPFSFSDDKKEVWVSGEAYFKVTKDAHRPFIVHTSQYDVQVLGTEFNINTYDPLRGSTALVSGAVSTKTADGRSMMVKPGYQAILGKGKEFEVSVFDIESKLSWMKGIYYFENALLEMEIASAIRRWYGATLVFDDARLSGARFTGALRKDRPLAEFLDNLSLVSGINYTVDKGVIHLRPR